MPRVITLTGLQQMGIANPATENCLALGGTIQVVKDATGEHAVCVFPDGTSCDEWALFRKECAPGGAAVVEEVEDPATKSYPKLLNFGISAGVGAIAGLIVASSKSKKFGVRAAGAGVGAAVTSLILLMMWPKSKEA